MDLARGGEAAHPAEDAAANAVGFAADADASWLLFLTFGLGVSLVLWAIAMVAWLYARRGAGRVGRSVTLVAGILCCALAANVLCLGGSEGAAPREPSPLDLEQ